MTSECLPGDSDRVAFWIGGTRDKMPNEYRDASPASFITPDDPPMYFFHGQQDVLVPVESPTEMVKLLKGAARDRGNVRRERRRTHSSAVRSRRVGAWAGICG